MPGGLPFVKQVHCKVARNVRGAEHFDRMPQFVGDRPDEVPVPRAAADAHMEEPVDPGRIHRDEARRQVVRAPAKLDIDEPIARFDGLGKLPECVRPFDCVANQGANDGTA